MNFTLSRAYAVVGVALILIVLGAVTWMFPKETEEAPTTAGSPKDATYTIEGIPVTLVNGYAENRVAEGESGLVTTRYFGNELVTDLDGDGEADDAAFIVTQESGGTGIFYYAVGAVNANGDYKGTDGYLLGDRIAPQSTNESQNPRHKNVVVFNYVDRKAGEPMTERPSLGKSVYLKLVPESMQWAIVEPDFEGESAL